MSVALETALPNNTEEGATKVNSVVYHTATSFTEHGDRAKEPQTTQKNGQSIINITTGAEPKTDVQSESINQKPSSSQVVGKKEIGVCEKITALILAVVFIVLGIVVAALGGPSTGWISLFCFIPPAFVLYLCFGSKYFPDKKVGVRLITAGIYVSALALGFACCFAVYLQWYCLFGFIFGLLSLTYAIGSWISAYQQESSPIFENPKAFGIFIGLSALISLIYLILLIVYLSTPRNYGYRYNYW